MNIYLARYREEENEREIEKKERESLIRLVVNRFDLVRSISATARTINLVHDRTERIPASKMQIPLNFPRKPNLFLFFYLFRIFPHFVLPPFLLVFLFFEFLFPLVLSFHEWFCGRESQRSLVREIFIFRGTKIAPTFCETRRITRWIEFPKTRFRLTCRNYSHQTDPASFH